MKMQGNSLEQLIVAHCAPTLAGLKLGSMFNYYAKDTRRIHEEMRQWNLKLNHLDLYFEILKVTDKSVMIYVYRKKAFNILLLDGKVQELLRPIGYSSTDSRECLDYLKYRVESAEGFPHEIGVFLGYPLHDVIGFIENHGENYSICGMWKVYQRQWEAIKLFEQYNRCKELLMNRYLNGQGVLRLINSTN